jgi:glutathione S-transferase
MPDVKLLGLSISVYTRIARLALEEKRVDYEFEEVDVFAESGVPTDYLELNPFGMIPTLLHGEFVLYETAAITRYIDDISPGSSLQPELPGARARMNQIIGVLDNYCYRAMVWDVYVQRLVVPAGGGQTDKATVAAALPGLRRLLSQLSRWRGEHGYLADAAISLADLHFYPMLCYFVETPEGLEMLSEFPRLQHWLQSMETRNSVQVTPFHDATASKDA